jgi:hypothetical protein
MALARRVRRDHLLLFATYSLAKVIFNLAPLAIAAVASDRLYGGIELALAIGLQICAFALGAPLAGINHVYLVQRMREVADLLVFLAFASAVTVMVVAAALWAGGIGGVELLTALVISAVVIQNLASVWTRMRGERNRAAWGDGASLLIAGAVVVATMSLTNPDDIRTATLIFALLTVAMAIGSGLVLFVRRSPDLLQRLRHVSRVGMPMMVAGAFAIWLGVGGRIIVGIVSHADLVAYSLAFRVAGLAIGVQQLALTFAFPRLYAARTREGDRLLGYAFMATFAVAATLAVAGPFVVDIFDFAALDDRGRGMYRALVPLCALQTFFWIGFALLQLRINRSRVAKASIMPILAVTMIGIALIFVAAHFVSSDVRFISWLVAAHAAAYFALAWLLLARRGLPHRRLGLVGLWGGLGLTALAALGSF